MTTGTEFTRTDAASGMPRWLALTLTDRRHASSASGRSGRSRPNVDACAGDYYGPGILPGPQPCGTDGSGPALVTAGILLTLLAAFFVVAFTVGRRRGMVLLIIAGVMLLVLLIGLLATLTVRELQPAGHLLLTVVAVPARPRPLYAARWIIPVVVFVGGWIGMLWLLRPTRWGYCIDGIDAAHSFCDDGVLQPRRAARHRRPDRAADRVHRARRSPCDAAADRADRGWSLAIGRSSSLAVACVRGVRR